MATTKMRKTPVRVEIVGRSKALTIAGRFITGKPLNGHPRTDATFLHPGARALDKTKVKINRWHYLPGYKKSLYRLSAVTAPVLTAALEVAGTDLGSLARTGFYIGAAPAAVAAGMKLRERQDKKTYLIPLARWYAAEMSTPYHDALRAITIAPNHTEDPDVASTVRLPVDFAPNDNQQAGLAAAVASRLGLVNPDWRFDHIGCSTLTISAAPVPPPLVTFNDMLPHLETPDDETLYLGMGRRNRPEFLSWAHQSPHALLSFETGMGKTNFAAGLVLQTIRNGGSVHFFDFAKHGESAADWCRDENGTMLPGFHIYLTVEEAHAGLIALAHEREARSKAVWERTATHSDFQRRLVIMEESNTSIPALTNHWKSQRETGDPYISPALESYRSLFNAGRSTKYNVVAICQKGSSRAAGGEEVRENTGIKGFGNSSVRTLKNLVEHIKPLPVMSDHPGRITIVCGQTVTDMQVGQWIGKGTDHAAAARAWAVAGVPQPVGCGVPAVPQMSHVLPETPDHGSSQDTWDNLGHAPAVPSEGPVSLADACRLGLLTITVAAARKAAQRPGFPEPKGTGQRGANLYDRVDLESWSLLRDMSTGGDE